MKASSYFARCPGFRALISSALIVALSPIGTLLSATGFRINSFTVSESDVTLEHDSDEAFYYILFRGTDVVQIGTAADIALGTGGLGTLTDTLNPVLSGSAFYRIAAVPKSDPLDVDGDGMDDVYELMHATFLDPLNLADASADRDGDGRSNLDEYTDGTDPEVSDNITTLTTSPDNGESGVALTRETVVRFSSPLSAATSVDASNLHAEFGGATLEGHIEVSTDRRKATLFYNAPLPANAQIRVYIDGSALSDESETQIDADGDGAPGGMGTVDFQTLSTTTVANTGVIGRVFASELAPGDDPDMEVNAPLEGVVVTVDGRDDIQAVTDEMGNFALSPVPAGRFFVHIDGRNAVGSSWPDGDYYPFVGKAFTAVAGNMENLAGGTGQIFLPLVKQGTLQETSAVSETEITFADSVTQANPELTGVSVTVPADSLFSDDGTRGGMVGIAPVPPDRLPGSLPPGLDFPLVITVQTDGPTNFDQPVPVRFPNLPDPKTGEKLPPGAKSALWSFDHDKGHWDVVGSMTVSEDGLYVVSDPGVGILAPGWHGTQPGCRQKTKKDPPCPGLGWWDAWDIGKSLYDCVKDMTRVLQVLGAFVDVINDVRTIANSIKQLRKDYAEGNLTAKSLEAGLNLLKAPKNSAKSLYDAFTAQNPLTKAVNIAKCASGIINTIIQKICGNARCIGKVVEYLCAGGAPAAALVNSMIQKIEELEKGIRQAPLLAVCLGLDAAIAGVQTGGAGQSNALSPLQDQPLTDEEILALLDDVIEATDNYEVEVAPAEAWIDEFSGVVDVFLDYQAQATQLISGSGGLLNSYYRMTYGEAVQRGRTDATGEISLLVAPDTPYVLEVLNLAANGIMRSEGVTAPNGQTAEFAPFELIPLDEEPDADMDGLPDIAEGIVGTGVDDPDSDDDGILDGAEVLQGTNPLDGVPVATGIAASVETPGEAMDICVVDDLAVVADGSRGITIFNVYAGLNPAAVGQVDTPGTAQRVACTGNLIAVADGAAGLIIVDISDPPNAQILHSAHLGGSVVSVATASTLAYVGLTSGRIAVVDMISGQTLETFTLAGTIRDLFFSGDHLYALNDTTLFVLTYLNGPLALIGSAISPYVAGPNSRLFVGDDIAYVVHGKGYNTFDVSIPATPTLITATDTGMFGWKQIVANGSGLGIAAASPNQAFDPPHNVSLYDISDPMVTDDFLAEFETPGIARAVAIYNGFAYIADHLNGMHVLNYLSFDTLGVPPTVELATSFSEGLAEEGQLIRVTASVTDDVQVRNVEFLVDGEVAAIDGNFPFEARFITPRIADQPEFTLQARATDSGGNTTLGDLMTISLVPDATPPSIARFIPGPGSGLGNLDRLSVFFNEPIDPSTIDGTSFSLTGAGPDGEFGTADDVVHPPLAFSFDTELNAVYFHIPGELPQGIYQVAISDTVADLAGNPLAVAFSSTFISGFGLQGDYFDELDFTAPVLTRVDPTVDFDWGNFSPDPVIGNDTFSVVWRGRVVPRFSENYTFQTGADDGVRLWVNNELIIDDWIEHPPATRSGTIELNANTEYDIRLEFFENRGQAVVRLYWQSDSQPLEIIPATNLLPYEDLLPPFVVRVEPQPSFEHVIVRFSEPVDQTEAEDAANYNIDGVTVTDAQLQEDGASVLLTTSPLDEAALYSLVLTNIHDVSDHFNPIDPENHTEFYSLQIGAGILRRDVWNGIAGGLVSDLTSDPRFPGNPDETQFIDSFESPINWRDNYGQQVSGWVCPPTTGWYEFRISSDDQSELHLSTDASPENLVLIATEPTYNSSRNWLTPRGDINNPVNVSDPVRLESGERYFIRALHKEGPSADNLAVLWRFLNSESTDDYFVIEAEDFDFGGGMHKPEASVMPYLGGAYAGESATDGVDYNDPGPPASTTYRPNSQGVATAAVDDPIRFGYDVTSDFQIGWAAVGDWYNYTRTFPAGTYFAFARMSSPGNIEARLERIGAAPEPLGTFTSGGTGGYSTFGSLPLLNPDGTRATVTLNGEETLRFTHVTSNCNLNYLVLVPANDLPEDVPFLEQIMNGAPPIPGRYLKTYRSPVGRGHALLDTFNGLTVGTLDNLKSLAAFPDQPDSSIEVTALEAPINGGDFIGRKIAGYLHIPLTGEYRFHIASDGPGEFRLSTDSSPGNLETIAVEPQYNASRYWTGPSRRDPDAPENESAPRSLQAGDVLYFEALMAEETGADNLGVAWRTPWSVEPHNGSEPIPGDFLSILDQPVALELTSVPQDTTVDEETDVVFRVGAKGIGPFRHQWLLNGLPVEGANEASLTISNISADVYDGARIAVTVNGFASSVTSDPATVTVVRDTTAPTAVSASGETSTRIRIRFSEDMDAASASNVANYSISGGVTVVEAILTTDPTKVVLVTSPMDPGATLTITISNVTDDSPLLNPIAAGTEVPATAPSLGAGFLNREIYENIAGTAVANLTADARFPNNPDLRDTLPTFESLDRGDSYGARIFGLVVPPVSGDYVFYISSDDTSVLYLSTDEDPANAVEIASAPAWSAVRQWTVSNQPTRISAPVPLVANERYYVEARFKEGGGGDHVEVTWQKPGETVPANGSDPIAGEFLLGYENP